MKKIWKRIDNIDFSNTEECLNNLRDKNYQISPWIENIFTNSNLKYADLNYPINLVRVNLEDLNFKNHTELKNIYNRIKEENLDLVPPQVALFARFVYDEQPSGEWLRFATPLKSMIDSDGVPHLPKLGKALNMYFVETYWAYQNAIFHPHNEFVFIKKY